MKKKNIFEIMDDYIGDHRVVIISFLFALVLGMLIGQYGVTSGIKGGYWEKSGYHYNQPGVNIIVLNINTDMAHCSGLALKSDRYFNNIIVNQTGYGYEISLNGNRVGGCIAI